MDTYEEARLQASVAEHQRREWMSRRIGELAEEFTTQVHAEGWLPVDLHFEYGSTEL